MPAIRATPGTASGCRWRPSQAKSWRWPARPYVDDAYQLFSDGTLVGSFGNFTGSQPTFYFTQPMMFNLPQAPAAVTSVAYPRAGFSFLDGSHHTCDPSLIPAACIRRRCWAMPARFQPDTSFAGSSLIRAQVAGALEGLLFLLLAVVAFQLDPL